MMDIVLGFFILIILLILSNVIVYYLNKDTKLADNKAREYDINRLEETKRCLDGMNRMLEEENDKT